MTREEFDALLALLDSDREAAGRKYEGIRSRLIRLFNLWGCTESESLADETFNRVARKAVEGLVLLHDDPFPYITRVARYVLQEWRRKKKKEDQLPESGDWPPLPQPEEEEPDFRLEHLRRCLNLLSADHRLLLLRYHKDAERILSRKILCDELGVPMNALRIRVHRLRKKVAACVQEKLRNRL